MTYPELPPDERDVVDTMRSMKSAGYGRIAIEINPHEIRIEPTERRRYKPGLDKKPRT